LRRSEIYALLDRAIGLLSADKLAELFEGYVDVRALSTGGRKRGRTGPLAAVQAFEEARPLNQAKTTNVRNCTTTIMSKIFMPGA